MKCKGCKYLEQENLELNSIREVLRSKEMIKSFQAKGYRKVTLGVEIDGKDRVYFIEAVNGKGHKRVKKESSLEELEYRVLLGNSESESDLL